MSTRHLAGSFALAAAVTAALALPAARLAAQEPATHDTVNHPHTVKQAASNVANESKRVYKRSEKTVRKAGNDTEKQAQRTGKHIARTVSPKERERQEAEKRAKEQQQKTP